MSNKKWYYLVNYKDKVAIEYTQIPAVWGNISGMSDLSDSMLRLLDWAKHSDVGFIPEDVAKQQNISQSSMDRVKAIGREVALVQLRTKRDLLLKESDAAVVIDRWNTYNDSKKTTISNYRQALRDLTNTTDPFNPTFPVIPTELAYLNAFV
jgi:hypothetical protein